MRERSNVRWRGTKRLGSVLLAVCLVAGLSVVAPAPVDADRRSDYLINLLQTSDNFRVRTQAVLSLGRQDPEPNVMRAVIRALSDPHPSVRAAAATSLGQLGQRSSLPALRAKRRDPEDAVRAAVQQAIRSIETSPRAVASSSSSSSSSSSTPTDPVRPSGPVRYYVGVGVPGNTAEVSTQLVRAARQFLERELRGMQGVEVAPDDEANSRAASVIRRRRLTGYFIDSSIVRVETRGADTRAVVSVILGTYPGRDMRAILQGSATVPGATGPSAQRQAIEGALRGALRRLPQAMQASAARAAR